MKKGVEKTDLYQLHLLSSLRASPSGSRLVYVHTQMAEASDTYEKNLWLLEGKRNFCIYQKQKFSAFLWGNEYTLLTRKPAKEQKTEFVHLYLNTLCTTPAFIIPANVVRLERISMQRYTYLAEESVQKQDDGDAIMPIQTPLWDNGVGYVSGKRNHLYIYCEEGQTSKTLFAGNWHVEDLSASNMQIVCSTQEYSARRPLTQGIFTFTTDTLRQIGLLNCNTLHIEVVTCEKDTIIFIRTDMWRYGNEEATDIYVWTKEQGVEGLLDCEHYAYCNTVSGCHVGASTSTMMKNQIVYHLKNEEGRCLLYALSMGGRGTYLTPKANVIRDIAVGAQGWYTLEVEEDALEEIYYRKQDGCQKLTAQNAEYLRTHRHIQSKEVLYTSREGGIQKGWILYPADYAEGSRYPGLLSIHGGPHCTYGNVFSHEMQMFVSMRYIVFYTNPRGSDSFGEEYADLRGKYDTIDYEDLMASTDVVLQETPQLDGGRSGVLGGSYGNFMTNWIITQTNRFQAAASQRNVANWTSDFGTSCIGYTFDPNEMQTTSWEDVMTMWMASPLVCANKVKTPTLFIHSLEDCNCPLGEGLQMFTALQYHDVGSRMCPFLQENHELSRSGEPKHRLRRLQEMADWFDAHLRQRSKRRFSDRITFFIFTIQAHDCGRCLQNRLEIYEY